VRRLVLAILLVLPLLASALPSSAQDARYGIKDLIKAHDIENEAAGLGAYDINDNGMIVGFTAQSATKSSPFYIVDGKTTRIKTGKFGATYGHVNANGVIVGRDVTGRNENGGPIGFPAFWADGKPTRLELPLDPLGQNVVTGVAQEINDAGLIVGEVQYPGDDFNQYVVLWQDGVPTLLPDAFGYPDCSAWGLTASGLVAGSCWEPNLGMFLPVLWQAQVPISLNPQATASMDVTAATDTAAGGYAVVGAQYDDPANPSYFDATVIIDGVIQALLGPAGFTACRALTVSQTEAGLLVGGSCAPDVATVQAGWAGSVAVAWLDGELIELNDAIPQDQGWNLILVRGVNGKGQMVGLGERKGERRSFVLTPIE
jgi:uncharacterized membrane protein